MRCWKYGHIIMLASEWCECMDTVGDWWFQMFRVWADLFDDITGETAKRPTGERTCMVLVELTGTSRCITMF